MSAINEESLDLINSCDPSLSPSGTETSEWYMYLSPQDGEIGKNGRWSTKSQIHGISISIGNAKFILEGHQIFF